MDPPIMQPLLLLSAASLIALTACAGCRSSEKPERQAALGEGVRQTVKPVQYPTTMPARDPNAPLTTQELYVAYCGACHSLALVESQRLDRANWDWVMEDMITEYGGAWITEQEREDLVDYLVEHLGPTAK